MLVKSPIKSSIFLSRFPEAVVKKIMDNSVLTNYKKGQMIFYQDALPFGVYFLEQGMVKLYREGPYGKNQIFQLIKDDEPFGYHAVLMEEAYPDSAETLTDCKIRFLPTHLFNEILASSKEALMFMLKCLSVEFREFIQQETILSQMPVRQRVVRLLIDLKTFYKQEDGSIIVPLPRRDLADLAGTVTESFVRVLKELKECHTIEVNSKGHLVCKDISKLKELRN